MKKTKVRRKRGSFISPLLSITFVLFLTGLFGMLVFYADQLKDYLKENVQVNIIFDDDAKEADIIRLQKLLDAEAKVIRTNYVDKEEAKDIMKKELGEDVDVILGFNPFPASLEVFFVAEYAEIDSIEVFKENLSKYPFVKEVSYQKVILENIDKNVRIGGSILLFFMVVFSLIAIVLINNTIRLTLYSQRFLIKTMQLVGATQSFIRKPYILKAIIFGLVGGILAIVFVILFLSGVNSQIPIASISDTETNVILAFVILLFGVLITAVSSYYSVRRYLRLKLDDLY